MPHGKSFEYKVLHCAAFILMLSVCWQVSGDGFKDDLIFSLSFEDSLNADRASGNPQCMTQPQLQKNIKYVPGVKGRGATEGLSYATGGNILPQQGTVLMWVQPLTWVADDGSVINFFSTGNVMHGERHVSSFMLYKYGRIDPKNAAQMWINNKLNVYSAMADEKDGKLTTRHDNSIPVDITNWKIGDWHHLALSWDKSSGLVKLYVDGFLKGTSRMPLPEMFTDRFYIGDTPSDEPRTAFDEVHIYNRRLTLDEIRAILLSEKP